MYAVVKIGGRQYRVSEGDVLFVDRQHEEPGNAMTFDEVLMTNDTEGQINVGAPFIEGAAVKAELLEQVKADKVIVFKKKRRKGYKKKNGHRQPLSQIRIDSISVASNGKAQKEEKTAQTDKESSASSKTEDTDTQSTSVDMTAKEASSYIRNTPLDQLEGFIPEEEDRVTVLKAWETKQNEEE
jgi:large subunit ribosomal protein L21